MRGKVQCDPVNVIFDFFRVICSSNIRSAIKEVQSLEKDQCFKIITDFEFLSNINFVPWTASNIAAVF